MRPAVDDDVTLEAELRRAASLLDPVPVKLVQDAIAAYAFRTVEAELAELSFDSERDAEPVRADRSSRVLTFTASALSIEVEIIAGRLVGQLLPARTAQIEVRRPDRTITVTADELGRFTAGPFGAGPFSLRCRLDPDVITEWVSAR